MNYFVFHPDPKTSAEWFFKFDSRRANKQILESAQMIAISCDVLGLPLPTKADGTPYGVKRHRHHPCTRWTHSSPRAFNWHLSYLYALCDVYRSRSGRNHACYEAIQRAGLAPTCQDLEFPPFVGSSRYCVGFEQEFDVFEKYAIYIANKWTMQDGKNPFLGEHALIKLISITEK